METQATMASISSTQLYDHDNKQEQANKNNTKHWSKGTHEINITRPSTPINNSRHRSIHTKEEI